MKRTTSFAAFVSAALVSLSVAGGASAADWTTYQGNSQHTGIAAEALPTTSNGQVFTYAKGGAINTVPVMQTLTGGDTYGYVLHNGGAVSGNNGGARLSKVNATKESQLWSKQLTLTAGFQLSTPLLMQGSNAASEADDAIYVGTTGFSQVLQNDELVGKDVSNWQVNGGTPDGEAIVLKGTEDTTLTQSGITLNTSATNRAALGIWVGNTATPGVAIDVTIKVDGVQKVKKSFTATSKATEDTSNLGNYYYYVNENFAATSGSTVTFEVDVISGNKNSVKVDYASLYQQTGSIQKVTNLQASSPSNISVVNGITGQINTPITTDGTYIYFGTWTGSSTPGKYYQVKIADNSVKTFTPDIGGFYWAGAVVANGYVYFGGDSGKLYAQPVATFGKAGTGTTVDLSKVGGVTAGNVRSTIAKHGDDLYFTSQSGYVWKFKANGADLQLAWLHKLPNTSTSTPTITSNNILYVGHYGGFNGGGVTAIDLNASTRSSKDVFTGGPVQSSIVAHSAGKKDYVYFTTNSATGGAHAYSYDNKSAVKLWDMTGGYTLQGMAASNGYLLFGNDQNQLIIRK